MAAPPVLGRVRYVLALLMIVTMYATGCGSDDGDSGDAVAGASTESTSASAPAPPSPSDSSVTDDLSRQATAGASAPHSQLGPATGQPSLPSDPVEYTAELVRAWGRGDREASGQYAVDSVVDALFTFADPGGPRWEANGCTKETGSQACTFVESASGSSVVLVVPVSEDGAVDGQVTSAVFDDAAAG